MFLSTSFYVIGCFSQQLRIVIERTYAAIMTAAQPTTKQSSGMVMIKRRSIGSLSFAK
jgi:hypothetical protein